MRVYYLWRTTLSDVSRVTLRRLNMTSPITEQARQVVSTATQEKPASLDNPRASSFLGPDKPAPVRKWFPTGHLAWREVSGEEPAFSDPSSPRPLSIGYPGEQKCFQLVQELFEVEFGPGEDEAKRTGRIEWRPIPILPPAAPVSNCAEIIIPAFDSTLINQAPHIAGPNQVPPSPG